MSNKFAAFSAITTVDNNARAMTRDEAEAWHAQYKLSPLPAEKVEMYRQRMAVSKTDPKRRFLPR